MTTLTTPTTAPANASDVMLDKTDLAARLKVSERTVEKWQHDGVIPYVKVGRVVLFHWPDVVEFLIANFRVCPGVVEGRELRVEGLHGQGNGQNECPSTSPPAPLPRQTAERVAPGRSREGEPDGPSLNINNPKHPSTKAGGGARAS